ncbi:MAG: choice-of-anchor J domain-containing protein [Flavobacteriales bacterium]|nr:choice-of-anchor J domain-containing protein [Flavobacteriales bacterium]
MINSKKILGIALLATTILFTSCEKEFDSPPINEIPIGSVLTVADVKALLVPGQETYFTTDISVYGVVTIDESTGNLYKETYIQDATGGLYLRFTSTSGVNIGDSVRINLNGGSILEYTGMLQINNLDPDNNVIKIETQVFKQPEITQITDLLIAGNNAYYQGRLIQLNDVEFTCDEVGNTFADAITQSSEDRNLSDTLGNLVIVRSSGFSNFANTTLPSGRGNLIAVVSEYNGLMQLIIRDPNELTLSGTRFKKCADFSKNFSDQSITSGGWSTQLITGTINWATSDQGSSGNFYGVMSNYISPNNFAAETWLISPSLDFSSSTAPLFDFKNAYNFSGTALEVLVSTNYDGLSIPATATWTPLSVQLSSGGFSWVNASDAPNGPVDLTPYLVNNVYIAFKYTGSASNGSTWEIDDIEITY